MLETTKQKVARMFKRETLERLDKAGLMVVDKQDFEATITAYNEMRTNEKALKARIRQMEAQLKRKEG